MTRGEKVIAFIEKFCFCPDGMHVGKPIKLDDFQKRFILEVYDNPHTSTRKGILSIARKNGKTALIACLVLVHLVGPEAIQNAQIISGAMSQDQAAIIYKYCCAMIEMSPEIATRVKILGRNSGRKKIIGIARNTEYRPISADGKTAHGLSPILAILDEIGQIRGSNSEFVDAIDTSQGAHENPLVLIISTQAPTDNALLSRMIDYALTHPEDKTQVCHLYTTPIETDLENREGWLLSNPALGTFRNERELAEKAALAKKMPSAESAIRNLLFNQRVSADVPFISRLTWQGLSGEIPPIVWREGNIYGGLDLSDVSDLTAFSLLAEYKGKFYLKTWLFTPEGTADERAKRDKAPYVEWINAGYLVGIDSNSIDLEAVAIFVNEILDMLEINYENLIAIGFDTWRINYLKNVLNRLGIDLPLEKFGQGFYSMAPAINLFESMCLNSQLVHDNNPVMNMCVSNARIQSDAAGNRKLTKTKSLGRIDGAISGVIAVGIYGQTMTDSDISSLTNPLSI